MLFWFPWLNFYTENVLLQFVIVLTIFLFITAATLYYAAIYLLLFVFLAGVFLIYYNLEVLTGFLFVLELTAFFIIILFLLALNFTGRLPNKDNFGAKCGMGFIILYLFFFYAFSKPASLEILNATHHWDDYYDAISDDIMNDIFGLYLSYYFFNSFIFFLFGFLIFIASLICINLFLVIRRTAQERAVSFKYVFDFFKDLLAFEFLRKQSSSNQTRRKGTTRLVRKKKKNVTKK